MKEKVIADLLMSIGFVVGITTKLYALYDKDTTWPRKSSGTNILTWPVTAMLPYLLLGTYVSLALATVKYFITIAKYIWRAPDNEDWLGRKTTDSQQ